METYFSVSLNGKFVFRTDLFLNASESELARVEATLRALNGGGVNHYKITRSDRPAVWTSKEIA